MISRNAVKESFDTLPAGIGCFDRNGLPRLINHKMQQLAAVLCGRDMQTLADLQQALRSPGGGVRLLDAEAGFYEFPDRRVYRFTARPCTDKNGVPYTEVMAVDATRPAALHEALKQENERLADANRRAKRLFDNMPDIVREEEILKMKMRVHDDIGHTMLAARRALRHEQPLEQIRAEAVGWERAIALLCRARQDDSGEDAIARTCTRAAALGVDVQLRGQYPLLRTVRDLYVLTLRACISNCVRHAGATELYADSARRGDQWQLCIKNTMCRGDAPAHFYGAALSVLRIWFRFNRQVMALDATIMPKNAPIPKRGSSSVMPAMRKTESSSEYRKLASCSPSPFSTPSTILSIYINGAAILSRRT